MDVLPSIGLLASWPASQARLLCQRCAFSPQIIIPAAHTESWASSCCILDAWYAPLHVRAFELRTLGPEE